MKHLQFGPSVWHQSDVGKRKRLRAGAAPGDPALLWRVLTRLSLHSWGICVPEQRCCLTSPPRRAPETAASTAQCWDLTVSRGLMPKHGSRIIPGGFGGNSVQIQVSAGWLEWGFARAGSLGYLLMAWLILGILQKAGESGVKLSSTSLAWSHSWLQSVVLL